MLIQGRGSVYYDFRHNFSKPPLQYWLTTLTLPRFSNPSTAVRIWPLLYGVLTAMTVGRIAFLIDPQRPWLIPLSVAIFVSCPLFSTEAIRALLDTGLVFFTTAAIGFAQLARRHPAWWLGVAIACWLGALQKIPLIFLVWLIIVVIRASSATERARLRSRSLIGSALLAAALALTWPLIQFLKYQMPGARAFAGDDLAQLFSQNELGSLSRSKDRVRARPVCLLAERAVVLNRGRKAELSLRPRRAYVPTGDQRSEIRAAAGGIFSHRLDDTRPCPPRGNPSLMQKAHRLRRFHTCGISAGHRPWNCGDLSRSREWAGGKYNASILVAGGVSLAVRRGRHSQIASGHANAR
jgi:Dolichyl-phosphate-mannose-protein mannosyltransferase